LQPGTKLRIAEIAEEFGVSATPMREALSRLVSRGLVVAVGQRGFRVMPVSREDLADITRTRVALETAALRRSMRYGDGKWEGDGCRVSIPTGQGHTLRPVGWRCGDVAAQRFAARKRVCIVS
jgi:Mn-dependent DtxR family transcriptional regulator